MAITNALCTSFKSEALQGIHLAADVYKIALYTSAATMDKSTTAYSATDEVSGAGYAAGGIALSGYVAGNDTDSAWLDWTTDPAWTTATITARGALIYNSTRSNKAVAVLDFAADKTSTNGTFTVILPVAAAGTAIIQLT